MTRLPIPPPLGGIDAATCADCSADMAQHLHGHLAHDPTCPTGRAMDAATARDRAYFEDHPQATAYVRDLMPGDLAARDLACVFSLDGRPLLVRVRRIADGVRGKTLPSNLGVFLASEDGYRIAARFCDTVLVREVS